MSLDYLNEAFKKLEAISLKEEAFPTSFTGINDLATFMNEDDTNDLIKVIDPEVQTEEELSDSYVGKVITECKVCHSKVFTAKEDILVEEDGSVNIDTQCPYCGEFAGFTILGEISPFNPDAAKEEDPAEDNTPEVKVDGEEVPTEVEPTEEPKELEESLEPCGPTSIESYLNDVEDGEGYVTIDKAVSDMEILGCPMTEEEIKNFVSSYNRAYMLTFGDIEIIFTPTAPSYDTVGRELGIDEASLTECVANAKKTINEARVRDFKPHTIRLLKLIGSDMVNGLEEEALTEAMNNVNVETDDTIVSVNSDENGKVTVSTEPKEDIIPETSEEMIVPPSDETLGEIQANNESEEEMPAEEEIPTEESPAEDEDVDFEDVDEEALDELGESYFKKVYENVNSYKTTNVALNPTKFIVEGLLTFKSGVTKKTGFVFESCEMDSNGKIRFLGENLQLSRGKRAFGLVGSIADKKFIAESFSYNYRTKNVKDSSDRISGVVTRK